MPQERSGQPAGRRDDRSSNTAQKIEQKIHALPEGLASYPAKDLVADAEALASELRGELKSAQIRKIYGEVKSLEMEFQNAGEIDSDKIILLRPKLAYAANKKSEVRPLQQVLDACIRKVETPKDFTRFIDFFEAILAYHR
jgi:CRISPR-associated protein Csm2